MFKKIIVFTFILTIIFSLFESALAEDADYIAVPSDTEILFGEKVSFDITTPSSVTNIKVYLDSKYIYAAKSVPFSDDKKNWSTTVIFKKLGSRKVSFNAYSSNGKLLKSFPGSPILITVKHLPPVTETPIILDSDRAVLLGTPPAKCGVTQSKYGFYFGTDSDSLTSNIKSNSVIRKRINKLVTGLSPETTYYYKSYVVTSKGTYTGEIVSFTTPAQEVQTAGDIASITEITDKYNYLFGDDKRFYKWTSKPYGYATESEADKHMVKVKMPVWKLSDGKKVSGTMSVTVNYKLKNSVESIFADIYDLDIKFPVISLKGYWYRKATGPGITGKGVMSHHSFGSAIDINKMYNHFYKDKDWRDKKSPYYIPDEVIAVFEKYGWSWGGNFSEGYDTMHFQYLGLDLLG